MAPRRTVSGHSRYELKLVRYRLLLGVCHQTRLSLRWEIVMMMLIFVHKMKFVVMMELVTTLIRIVRRKKCLQCTYGDFLLVKFQMLLRCWFNVLRTHT